MNVYARTISLCPCCAKDSPAFYEEEPDGMYLRLECPDHGPDTEKVENDSGFFKTRYELSYERTTRHLALPVTYRCNLRCRYCYTLSNSSLPMPKDRSFERLLEVLDLHPDTNTTFIGGEPTLRDDLIPLIRRAKLASPHRKISIGTNGQKLRSIEYVRELKEAGLDFVFLSLNDVEYDGSEVVHANKVEALKNCRRLGMPVCLQRTIDDLRQIDSMLDLIDAYRRVIFFVTLRAVKPFGACYPDRQIFVSDLLAHLNLQTDYAKGVSPFNACVSLKGKTTKLCSWVNDMKRLDPIDSFYFISNDVLTTFHRGMKMDEVLIKGQTLAAKSTASAKPSGGRAAAQFIG